MSVGRRELAEIREQCKRQSAEIAHLTDRATRLAAYIERLTEDRKQVRSQRDFLARENRLTTAFIRFAQRCQERAPQLVAEAYIAHGVEALLAANAVAGAVGGRVYGDIVEMPSFAERSQPYDLDPVNLALLDQAFAGLMREADGISTIGWTLKDVIEGYGQRRVAVVPNYRRAHAPEQSSELREQCGIGPDDQLLLASSTITSGFEPVIEALSLLPSNVHLATLGTMPAPYRLAIDAVTARLGVGARVHFFAPVPYERLTSVSSGADLGLMAVDPSVANDRVALPNRLFDCIAAELPIVTPDVPDIARLVRQCDLGVTLAKNEAPAWAEAIRRALAEAPRLRANARAAAKALTWESLEDELLVAYGDPRSVTIVSFSDLTAHQRTRRMADTFVKRGVGVTICCPAPGDTASAPDIPGVRFVFTPRYSVAPPRPSAAVDNAVTTSAGNVASGTLKRAESPRIFTAADETALEQLKQEVMALRYKAQRYDGLKDDIPAWRSKAARYDLLRGRLLTALRDLFGRAV